MAKRKNAVKAVEQLPAREGDTVKIRQGSRAYNGSEIPAYLFVRLFKVGRLIGNKAHLFYNGMKIIEVNVHNLTVVERVPAETPPATEKGDGNDHD